MRRSGSVAAPGRRAAIAAAAVAAVLFALPAAAYVRTTDAWTGEPLAWPLPAVAWHLNRDWPYTAPSCEATAAGDPTLDAVRRSFAEWEQPCTDLRLLYAGDSRETRVGAGGAGGDVVVFRRGWCSQNLSAVTDPCWTTPGGDCAGIYDCYQDSGPGDWAIVALTSVLYDPSTGRILSADIELNGWDGVRAPIDRTSPTHGWYFTCYPGAQPATDCTSYGQDGCTYLDLQNTVTHEVGHFVGLAHPCTADPSRATAALPWCSSPAPDPEVAYTARTMAPTTAPGDVAKRTLSADDVAGVCAIYPPASGGCGCGAGTGAGTASLLLVALALRPRRRALTRR